MVENVGFGSRLYIYIWCSICYIEGNLFTGVYVNCGHPNAVKFLCLS